MPHPSLGEEVKAFVIRKPGAEITEAELIEWGKERMAGYKYPRDRIPREPADDGDRQDPQARAAPGGGGEP